MKKLFLLFGLFSVATFAQFNSSPNMGLTIPVVGETSGPQWAQDINTSLQRIDQHDHTPGNGVQITPAGLNINTDLAFSNNSATNLKSTVFTPQTSYTTDYGVHVEGVDLYYVDGNGNDVRLTSGGTVNATSSGIVSGTASASFSAGVLVVDSAASTPANIQAGSILIGNNTSGSDYITLQAPTLSSNYSVTLPTVPASQSFLSIDASGKLLSYAPVSAGITGSNLAANTITRSNLAAVGQQVSSSCGTLSPTASRSYTQITNLTVTITTSGRPVIVMLQPDGSGASGNIAVTAGSLAVSVFRGLTNLGGLSATSSVFSNGNFMYLDAVSAGTYTYTAQYVNSATGVTNSIDNLVLVAYEL